MFLNKEVEAPKTMSNSSIQEEKQQQQLQFGPPCPTCGNMTVRTGACYSCKCGYNGGCG